MDTNITTDTKSDDTDDQNSMDENNESIAEDDCTPYSDAVSLGKSLYTVYCIACHKQDAESGEADIRGSDAAEIAYAFRNATDMDSLGYENILLEDDIDALVAYLAEIETNPGIAYEKVCSADLNITRELLGNQLFLDSSFSLRRTIACSSCHNPSHAFIDARYLDADTTNPVHGALSVGDDDLSLGGRNTPTILYAQFTPDFGMTDGLYKGGMFHNGRAANLQAQAKGPFLDGAEMMMPDIPTIVERVKENAFYTLALKNLYGNEVFDSNETLYDAMADAIAAYEKTDTFAPFDSRYDRSRLDPTDADYYAMSTLEAEGYALFFSDELKCKVCHTVSGEEAAAHELFTDHGYHNTGRPKNREALIARDGSDTHTDYGLGGRKDINESAYYGLTRTPTLRNIAVTGPYMNNGVFRNLTTVLQFYDHMTGNGSHDINPESGLAWEEAEVNETVDYALLHANMPLDDGDIAALEAFLKTLTDSRYEALLEE